MKGTQIKPYRVYRPVRVTGQFTVTGQTVLGGGTKGTMAAISRRRRLD
jgi:predicted Rossmann-fold nucleotide-binding protein